MPRTDQRSLPLLVVLVAMLGVLGIVVADGWAARAVPVSAPIQTVGAPVHDGVPDAAAGLTTTVVAITVGDAVHAVAPSVGRVLHPAERAGFVQVTADQVRPVAQSAPALLVLAAVFVAAVGGRSIAPTLAAAVARPLPLGHVRRRGPPALAVV